MVWVRGKCPGRETSRGKCIPASDAASCVRLELGNDSGQFHVAFFLEVGQHSRPEEDLALTDAVQISIQIQRIDLPQQHTPPFERRFLGEPRLLPRFFLPLFNRET